MKKLIAFLLIVSTVYAGEIFMPEINYKTHDGLEAQVKKILAVTSKEDSSYEEIQNWDQYAYDIYLKYWPDRILKVDTVAVDTVYKAIFWQTHTSYFHRKFRGLEMMVIPHWSPDSGYIATRKAILIYEEFEQ